MSSVIAAPRPRANVHPALNRHAAGALFGRSREPFSFRGRPGSVPGFVVQAVLQFADDRSECGEGRLALRLTRTRASEHAVRVILGSHAERALRICVVWDPAEGQIVAIGEDDPPAPQRLCGSEDELWDEGRAVA